ncbi:MAG: signal peptide peptidase SppA [Sphingomonadales bacterium]
MKRFLVGFWRGLRAIQRFVGTLLFLIVVIAVVSFMLRDTRPRVPDGAALVLNLNGVLVEQKRESEPAELLGGELADGQPPQILLRHVVDAIDYARNDDRIKALVLSLDGFGGGRGFAGGPSKLHRVGLALTAFKESGKPIVAVGDSYDQNQYFLAAHADTLLMHPFGAVFLEGYGRFRLYYKSLLNKLKVTANVFRVGNYKSAVEPYIRDGMSPAAREANAAFLGDLWNHYLADVEAARGVPTGTVTAYIENMTEVVRAAGGDLGKAALDAGFVDGLKNRGEQRAFLVDLVGEDDDSDSYRKIGYKRYLRAVRDEAPPGGDRIAVVVASGAIVDGDAPAGVSGGDTIARLIRRAREDDGIKAIVLRVDSGGGSAFASEVIRNELVAARTAGKPVVASMGSVAASGGYWISASADEIWAAPMTVTGSIGIYGFLPTFEKSLDFLGVHSDGVGTTSLSGAAAATRQLSPAIADVIQQSIEEGYERFITLVAQARGKTPKEIDAIGQGRVWSGATAHELGLIDKLGYLEDAVGAAAALASIEDYEIDYIEEPPSFLQLAFEELLDDARLALGIERPAVTSPLSRQIRRIMSDFRILTLLNDPNGAYALCLACSEITN